jgi:hypothetical protein
VAALVAVAFSFYWITPILQHFAHVQCVAGKKDGGTLVRTQDNRPLSRGQAGRGEGDSLFLPITSTNPKELGFKNSFLIKVTITYILYLFIS